MDFGEFFVYSHSMEIIPIQLTVLKPPQDSLFPKIVESSLVPQEGDVIAVSSKVVAIGEGRCVLASDITRDELVRIEAEKYLERNHVPGGHVMHTITQGTFIPNAGIDPFAGYYVLWPKKPKESADILLAKIKEHYGVSKLGLILTDSRSVMLRRGVVGIAIAWSGFEPIHDTRIRTDLLGHQSAGSQTNIPDALAAAAVLVMGEANEQTPLVCIRNAPYVFEEMSQKKKTGNTYEFPIEEDIFAPFLISVPWKHGGNLSKKPAK